MIDQNKNLISFSEVSFKYSQEPIIRGVSFNIKSDDFIAIIGPNGAGKTTIFKLILGQLTPSSGFITRNITQQDIGYVPQQVTQKELNFPATVIEIVRSGVVSESKTSDIDEALKATDISDLKNRLIYELSGGQRQRVYIARALAGRPKLLLLDEPETGIDLKQEKEFYEFLLKINRDFHVTIAIISHNIEAIQDTVKSIICINRNLTCHIESKNFDHDSYIKQLYAESYHPIHHQHQ